MPKEGPPYPDDAKKQDAVEAPGGDDAISSIEEAGHTQNPSEESVSSEELAVVPENAHALRINEDIDTPREARQEILRQLKARAGRTTDAQPAGEITDAPKESAAAPERAALKKKEAAYLAAYKDLERRRTIINRLLLRRGAIQNEEKKVEALRREYDESRVAYANALTKNVSEKVSERTKTLEERTRAKYEELKQAGTLERTESGEEISFDIFMRRASVKNETRAERVAGYLRFREVVRPLAEKKNAARLEALSGRKRNAFDKALAWSGKINAGLDKKYGKTGARVIRAAASAVLISGGAAALGAAGVTAPLGLAALAGVGTYKFARSLGGIVLGAAAGETSGAVFEVFGRKAQQAARESLRQTNRKAIGAELDVDSLRTLDTKREKFFKESDETVFQKRKAITKALVAMGVGAGSAAALADFAVIQEAATVVENTDSLSTSPVPPVESGVSATETDALKVVVEETPVTTSPEVPPAAPSPEVAVEKQSVESVVSATPAPEVRVPSETSPVVSSEIPSPSLEEQAKITADLNMQQVLSGGQEIPPMTPGAYDTSISYESYLKGATPASITPEALSADPEPLPSAPDIQNNAAAEFITENSRASSTPDVSPDSLDVEGDIQTMSGTEVESVEKSDLLEPAPGYVTELPHEASGSASEPTSASSREELSRPQMSEQTSTSSAPEGTPPAAPESYASASSEDLPQEGTLNAHGVDLSKPSMVKVGDTYFAQGGGGNEQNYEMARAFARAHPGTPAYFVEDRISALGGLERTVRGLILDPASAQGAGMVVPYVSEGGLPLPVPPIPHPDNYEPVPPTL